MKQAIRRNLKTICAAAGGVAVGLLVGSAFLRPKAPNVATDSAAAVSGGEAALDRVVPEIDLKDVPFDEAVEALGKAAGAKLVVRWSELDSLESPPRDHKTKATLRAQGVRLSVLLTEVLHQVYAQDRVEPWIAYAPDGDAVLVSSFQDLARRALLVRAYDVRDLFRHPETADWHTEYPGVGTARSEADALQQVLQEAVAPVSWDSSTTLGGRMTYVADRLVVTQSWENHHRIADFLARLRATRPAGVPPARTPDAKVWDEALGRFVSTDPDAGEAALRRRVREVHLNEVSLRDAVTFLVEVSGAYLVADWDAIVQFGQAAETPVSLDLRDVTLAAALRELLQRNELSQRVTFGPEGAHVLVTSQEQACRVLVTRVYDVRDWLATASRDLPPTSPPTPPMLPPPAPPGGLRTVFGGGPPELLATQPVDRLARAIMENVAPSTWVFNGLGLGHATGLNGLLVVTQTWETQEKVADFLSSLRRDPARLRAALSSPPEPRADPAEEGRSNGGRP